MNCPKSSPVLAENLHNILMVIDGNEDREHELQDGVKNNNWGKLVNTVKRPAFSISNREIMQLLESTLSQWDYIGCKRRRVSIDMLTRKPQMNINTNHMFLKRVRLSPRKRGLSLLIQGNTSSTNFFILILPRLHRLKQTVNSTPNILKMSEPRWSLKKIKS